MTAAEEIVKQATPAQLIDASETKDRRRARSVVSSALLKAGTPLDNRGLKGFVLPGLWNAAVNVLIELLDDEHIVPLLADRQRGIVGHGDNANSPIRQVSDREAPAHRKHVAEAGQAIMECLGPALDQLEKEGLDDRFPETVFDAALTVLLPAWGPDHVRRAIGEQTALLLQGVFEPLNFMEPVNFLAPAQPKAPPEETAKENVPHPAAAAAPRRQRAARVVHAWVCSDMSDTGAGAWAVSMKIHGDDVSEERLMWGRLPDTNGRANGLKAIHECVLAACADTAKASVRIEVGQEFLVSGINNLPGARIASEEAVWNDVDAAMAVHEIAVAYREGGLSHAEVEKCHRKIQFVLGEG